MTTKTINAYTYNELSPKAQATARDWWREASAGDSSFSEFAIDDAEECLAHAGFDIDKVYFSGFWSQGDGACFVGSWRAQDVDPAAMREHAPTDERLHSIADQLAAISRDFPRARFTVEHTGRYSHEYCTQFDFSITDEDDNEMDTPERHDAERRMIEVARSAMRWIYRQLESAYEDENSDERIGETLEINEYLFTEDGKRTATL